ncbi:peptidase inhibitor family I36 protein [Paenarthrobacter sp. CM16]|uniref:peptidase inhibitor family I36 protein n=1 Tax=Paenarthrobacter sp. CM16 TaxID=2738447 RepID=UPI001557A891|nr:peptidase inhibitor family I36 protein [Paenarthrobacter sp. CM16]NQD89570.1 peptidase inhibitor family I36 protein [Paenarthrobacter sp. CM16]
MKLSSRIASSAALLGLVAGAFLAGAPAASASGTGTACPSDRLCLYFNSNFQGARADYKYSDAGLGNELFTDGHRGAKGWGVQVNNNAASLINNSGEYIALYKSAGCRDGVGYLLAPGAKLNLSDWGARNTISSFHINDSVCISRDQSWA